jgi:HD-GYP domain-containing protein (c-di-GMP phosphodiesterase class II)
LVPRAEVVYDARVSAPRLAELLGSLSLATDHAAGLPPETAIRTSVIAVRLGARCGVQGFRLVDLYFTGLLRFLGCSAYSYEMAHRFAAGDDLRMIRELTRANTDRPSEALAAAARGANPRASFAKRAAALARFATSPETPSELSTSHCELAVLLARRLGMSEGVLRSLGQIYERWDGKGAPAKLRGDEIEQNARIVHVAFRLAAHLSLADDPIDAVELRSGRELDPAIAKLIDRDVLVDLSWTAFLDAEPSPRTLVAPERVREIAAVFGQFADVKSPWTSSHSQHVADIVGPDLAIAALLHDIGRVAVPNGVWDKAGALTPHELELMKTHTWHGEQILGRTALLAEYAKLATSAHERLDGRGYHRGANASAIDEGARVLAAADVLAALTEDRPHRARRTREEAAAILSDEARAGALARSAVDRVLSTIGEKRARDSAGLSDRELEILRLVAAGKVNREIARALFVAPATVKRHLENIFDKTGVRTRAALAVWAAGKGLL